MAIATLTRDEAPLNAPVGLTRPTKKIELDVKLVELAEKPMKRSRQNKKKSLSNVITVIAEKDIIVTIDTNVLRLLHGAEVPN